MNRLPKRESFKTVMTSLDSATLASLNAAGKTGRFLSSNIYPCASTTSGVSSASEVDDEDENAYYSSRGAPFS